jgi:class 3 adenylate cyclase
LIPESVREHLRDGASSVAERFDEVTVLHSSMAGFETWSRGMTPGEVVRLLDEVFDGFDQAAELLGVTRLRTAGDGYLAAAGMIPAASEASDAVAHLALRMVELAGQRSLPDGSPLELRVGIHTGPATAGVLGDAPQRYDLWGEAVQFALRLESHGPPGRIQLSGPTAARLSGAFRLKRRGSVALEGGAELEIHVLEGLQ